MKLYDLVFKLRSDIVKYQDRRSAWSKGVFEYELDMIENIIDYYENIDIVDIREFKSLCLTGVTDFYMLSKSGWYLIYDGDIAKRLCNNTELKRTKNGKKQPNKFETWLDVQGRALYQAYVDLEIHAARYLMRRCNHDKL
nr:MAG TPA: hypothetical protein [Caudoviricetes sp.]